MKQARAPGVGLLEPRTTLSCLRGPMTREDLRRAARGRRGREAGRGDERGGVSDVAAPDHLVSTRRPEGAARPLRSERPLDQLRRLGKPA